MLWSRFDVELTRLRGSLSILDLELVKFVDDEPVILAKSASSVTPVTNCDVFGWSFSDCVVCDASDGPEVGNAAIL